MNVYLIHYMATGVYENGYDKEIREIKDVNPDKIICACTEEVDGDIIFKKFFDGIYQWLIHNNKTIDVITAGTNRTYRKNINAIHGPGVAMILNRQIASLTERTHYDVPKLFTCYINNPRYERAVLLDQLVKHDMLSNGIVTFANPTFKGFDSQRYEWKYHNGLRLYDEPDFELNANLNSNPYQYPASFFDGLIDIVPESRIASGDFYMSEKTAKSIIGLKPFIALSCPKFHQYLVNEYGFELYDELFDYSFDDEIDLVNRIEGIIENVKNIDKSKYESLIPKLKRNKERLLSYTLNKDKMFPDCLRFLTETDYTMHGHVNMFETFFDYYRNMGWIK